MNDELELRVIERTTQLEIANRELEAFTYSISHDLRAPIRHIAGFAGTLLEEEGPSLNPRCTASLRRIQSVTGMMGQMIDGLLSLARVGRKQLVLQVTGLDGIVAEVLEMLKSDFANRSIEWRADRLSMMFCIVGDSAL